MVLHRIARYRLKFALTGHITWLFLARDQTLRQHSSPKKTKTKHFHMLLVCVRVWGLIRTKMFANSASVTEDVRLIPFCTLPGFLVQRPPGAGSLLQQCKQQRRPATDKSVAASRQQQRLSEAAACAARWLKPTVKGEEAQNRGAVAHPWHSSASPSQRANTVTSREKHAGLSRWNTGQTFEISSASPASPRTFKAIDTFAEDLWQQSRNRDLKLRYLDPLMVHMKMGRVRWVCFFFCHLELPDCLEIRKGFLGKLPTLCY